MTFKLSRKGKTSRDASTQLTISGSKLSFVKRELPMLNG